MPRYRLTERSFVHADGTAGGCLYEAGSEIEFSGTPARNMVALDGAAAAALARVPPINALAANILPCRGDPAGCNKATPGDRS